MSQFKVFDASPTVLEINDRIVGQIRKNSQRDLFHKAFLRPIEIALKTWDTQEKPKKIGSLPSGLKQVVKSDISSNNYFLANFESFQNLSTEEHNYAFVSSQNYDNMISLLKPGKKQSGLKLAICISLYSQGKMALKRTLTSVFKNIEKLVEGGVGSDKIAVFVIIDGIETVSPSMVQYITELQKQNGIYLEEAQQNQLDLIRNISQQIDEGEDIGVNKFLFDEIEYHDRQQRRFSVRKAQYEEAKKIIKQVQVLEKDRNITVASLNDVCKEYFYRAAKRHHQVLYAEDEEQMKKYSKDYFLEEYGQNISASRPLIREALNETKKECIKYLNSRDNFALMNVFRTELSIKREENNKRMVDENEEENLKMNLFVVTKYRNGGKISTHDWFFNGFCKQLSPEFAVILDTGLIADEQAIYKMVNHMEAHDNVGGVCGYMAVRIQKTKKKDEINTQQIDCLSSLFLTFVDIQRAQQIQYHFSHLVDKPFQSFFRFIHVLPGGFSGYRMEAIQPLNDIDSSILKQYFKSINDKKLTKDIKKSQFSSLQVVLKVLLPDFLYYCCFPKHQNSEEQLLYDENVHTAEDRILCMGIHSNRFKLDFLPDACCTVDAEKTLQSLMGQRKRWINGSYFAFERVKEGFEKFACCTAVQILFISFLNLLSFLSPSLFLFTIQVSLLSIDDLLKRSLGKIYSDSVSLFFVYLVMFFYVLLLLSLILRSLHFKSKDKSFYPFLYFASTMLGIISIIIIAIFAYDVIQNSESIIVSQVLKELLKGKIIVQTFRYLIYGFIGLHALSLLFFIIVYCQFHILIEVLFGLISFFFYGPTYMALLNIYAISRIDDLAWATKGLDEKQLQAQTGTKESWNKIKMVFLAKFVFWNTIMSAILLTLAHDAILRFFVTYVLVGVLCFTTLVKVFFGILYNINYRCCLSRKENFQLKLKEKSLLDDRRVEIFFKKIKHSLYSELMQSIQTIKNSCDEQKINFGRAIIIGGTQLYKLGRETAKINNKMKNMSRINNSFVFRKKSQSVISVIELTSDEESSPRKKKFARENNIIISARKASQENAQSLRELNVGEDDLEREDLYKPQYRKNPQIK